MRKNLLLLIMFCLIATIGAKAEVKSAVLSTDKSTLTITVTAEGDIKQYFTNNNGEEYKKNTDLASALNGNKLTSVVVIGKIGEGDLSAIDQLKCITSLDLGQATTTSTDYINLCKKCNCADYFGKRLKSLIFPTGITEIPVGCLQGFTALENVTIPNGYTTIAKEAFNGCTALKNINIPAGITTLGESAFKESGIQKVSLPEGLETIGKNAFYNCKSLVDLTIPEGVTEIGEYAFGEAIITSVRLPNSLLKIGANAFVDCANLASITIPANVTSIGDMAFNNCHGLKDVYVIETDKSNFNIPKLEGDKSFGAEEMYGCGGGYPTTTSTNREVYWGGVDTNHHISLLHYPDIDGYKDLFVAKNRNYTIPSDEKEKIMEMYPTADEGKAVYNNTNNNVWGGTTNDTYSWKRFVLSTTYTVYTPTNIIADRWYTICFDFNMTKDQILSAFGPETEVCRFNGVKKSVEDGDNVTTLDFTYDVLPNAAKKLNDVITEAGKPYMIHPSIGRKDGKAMTYYISGVEKQKDCQMKPDYGQVFDTKNDVAGYYSRGSYIFNGNLSDGNVYVPVGNYFLSRDQTNLDLKEDGHRAFYYNSQKANFLTWPKYTATLYEVKGTINHTATSGLKAKTGIALGSDAVIFTSDNSTTGIEDIESDNNETSVKFADKVFSISGQLVRTGSSSLDGLAKGIYIVNGKKYIVR